MLVLDTNTLALLENGGTEGQRIRVLLRSVTPAEVATTVVNYEEQMRGWMARAAKADTTKN